MQAKLNLGYFLIPLKTKQNLKLSLNWYERTALNKFLVTMKTLMFHPITVKKQQPLTSHCRSWFITMYLCVSFQVQSECSKFVQRVCVCTHTHNKIYFCYFWTLNNTLEFLSLQNHMSQFLKVAHHAYTHIHRSTETTKRKFKLTKTLDIGMNIV